MVVGQEPFGKEAFRAASQPQKDLRIEGTSDIREIEVLGDWAWLRNYLTVTVTPPGGQPIRRAGWTLTILRKTPGRQMAAGARRQPDDEGRISVVGSTEIRGRKPQ